MNNIKLPRVLVLLASLLLVGAIFFPLWQIQLNAPQYPEGLVLKIRANGLGGNVDVVNGLNHYIGMRTLHSEDFIEFTLLPYLIGGLVVLGLIVVFINRKRVYYTYIALFMLMAIISMVDFYRWEYDYGHNLDPDAAIQVPGMYYQPPLLGYKQLLNFGAYSIPDIGGWLFIAAGVLLALAYLLLLQPKWLAKRNQKIAVAAAVILLLQSCSSGPQSIRYGADMCDFCKMTIMDKKFACEWVTTKGKVFRFDDTHCLLTYTKMSDSKGQAYLNDFSGNAELVKANELFFVNAAAIKAPMGGTIAAFADKHTAESFSQTNNGTIVPWEAVEKTILK